MSENGFESRIKIQQVIENQLPEFILDENPKASEFLKQYYISQEFQGGPTDISENLDQYLNLDNLIPEVIVDSTKLSESITSSSSVLNVNSTKGFPKKYGLLQIDDEIITYTDSTENSFIGCVRGFSGITNYHKELDYGELVFNTSESSAHSSGTIIKNLSSLFLKEFYRKIKFSLTPGLEDTNFVENLNVGNFIRNARTFYQTKGTPESFRILFNALFGETPTVIDLEKYLIKSSDAYFLRRDIAIVEAISGDPTKLVGQKITKTTDFETTASVSKVETFIANNKKYYKLYCFVGYDDTYPNITGTFSITDATRVLENTTISLSSSPTVLTVDSTIGFPNSGVFYYNDKAIHYIDKSINQFFGCHIDNLPSITIPKTGIVRSNNTYFGYEDGDLEKKVEFRITGVLSDINLENNTYNFIENEEISPKCVGESIGEGKTRKQIFANSWIYNTSSRYQVERFSNATIILKTTVDLCNISPGDFIEILARNSETLISGFENVQVISISNSKKSLQVNVNTSILSSGEYDIRRKIKKASSSGVPIEYGNNKLFADVQNVYSENSEYMYVASQSLPSYQIELESNILKYIAQSVIKDNTTDSFCSTIRFSNPVSFITGDLIYYKPGANPIIGLDEGNYYIRVLSGNRRIKLYQSKTSIFDDDFIVFQYTSNTILQSENIFVLDSQKSNLISPQKILQKFKLNPSIFNNETYLTSPGPIGMLKNGVEIINYKSSDTIFYGPIKNVDVLNGGTDYDVINPPLLEFSYGNALLQPVIKGSVKKIYVDPQDFNIDEVVSISLIGGNGFGAIFEPVIEKSRREIQFDGRLLINGGGVDNVNERITFITPHNLIDGQIIIYDKANNISGIGIGTYLGSNNNQFKTLIDGSTYYVKVINDRTVQLYESFSDYNSGINTVGFTTAGNSGIHKFKTELKNTLKEIKVVSEGSNYTNRKLIVSPSGISTVNHTINYENHGFSTGELIQYSYINTAISGISTTKQYYVLKEDDNKFKICDAGIGGAIRDNYEQKKYVKFANTGSGYQIFKYPDITLNVTCTLSGNAEVVNIKTTPIIKGSISDVYVYSKGSNYGSEILNFHQRPKINVINGSGAQLRPIISDGKIFDVGILYSGRDYYSTPELIVIGDGIGAILRPVIFNNKIVDVIIISQGTGYTTSNTRIVVKNSGTNVVLQANVRPLTVNNAVRYGIQTLTDRYPRSEFLTQSQNNLQYSIFSYSEKIKQNINDSGNDQTAHSPIIGWAYDGNPIYGPYGYSDPNNRNSTIKRLESGYSQRIVENRPYTSKFPIGYFVEDFQYTNSGDLDQYNGRFCKTKDFPNGTYAYFASVENNAEGSLIGKFPYFIGNEYRSEFLSENKLLNQHFDFNNSDLIRNTYPYKVDNLYSDNDFIIESNEIINQKTIIESITSGSVDSFEIVTAGSDYRVGDSVIFDESNTDGSGISVKVSDITGKTITNLQTTFLNYDNSPIVWENEDQLRIFISPYHSLLNSDSINISGISTDISNINGQYLAVIEAKTASLEKFMGNYSITGEFVDIYLSSIPRKISIGSYVKIDSEICTLVEKYSKLNIIRVKREASGVSHSAGTIVYFLPDSFVINKKVDHFKSKQNQIIYFNPTESIGVGTISGSGILRSYDIGDTTYTKFVPTQSIYLQNHPFKTGQEIIARRPNSSNPITVKNTPDGSSFTILGSTSQTLYVINKNKDFIGLTTNVENVSTTDGLYFINSGSNNFKYSIETNYPQILVNVNKINSTVTVSENHNLSYGDEISLTVVPKLSVGIGTSTSVKVKYNSSRNKLIVNPINFNSSSVNTSTNSIEIQNHNFETGDKVLFETSGTSPVGLSVGDYFVYKVDNDNINLCQTYSNCFSDPIISIDITSSGSGVHTLSLINPAIQSIRNNNIVFDVSDSSLIGYNLNFYTDTNFSKLLISDGISNSLLVTKVGVPGVDNNASVTLNYSEYLPSIIYYGLEKQGKVISNDKEVISPSEINYKLSSYNGNYIVNGIGNKTFSISLNEYPERLNYTRSNCKILSYSTSSLTTKGGISKVSIISGGTGYKSIPLFNMVESIDGSGAYLIPKSNTIGKILQTKTLNEGFEYSSDRTLRPSANISKTAYISSSNKITNISVLYGGKNYISEPDLIVVDSITGKQIESGVIKPKLFGSSISSVEIDYSPRGLPDEPVKIRSINNSNGVAITRVEIEDSIVSCFLATPIAGFTQIPFSVGDKIFVEGIEKIGTSGSGFNSSDYGYNFFTVHNFYNNPISAVLEFDISDFTSNPGTPNPIQNNYASVVNYNDYPQFEVEQSFSTFLVGESLSILNNNNFKKIDLIVNYGNKNLIKVNGSYSLKTGNVIRGEESLNEATVSYVSEINGNYNIGYFSRKNIDWQYNTGKLSDDSQVTPDNDYYQNLSYTVKSTKTWDEIITPVNNLLHTSGLKNFSDTQVISSPPPKVGIGTTRSSETIVIKDYISDIRVDTFNNFDLTKDVDVLSDKSKFLKFNSIFLSDYILCKTNRVLNVDDFSDQFSSFDDQREDLSTVISIDSKDRFNKFLILFRDVLKQQVQFTELIAINNNENIYNLIKSNLSSVNESQYLVEPSVYVDKKSDFYLKFDPIDPYDSDFDIKILQDTFLNNTSIGSTQSIGFVDLLSSNKSITSQSSLNVIEFNTNKYKSIYANIHISNENGTKMNYVEIYLTHDGSNTYLNECYFDNFNGRNITSIGTFSASISNNNVSLTYLNNAIDTVKVISKFIAFGDADGGDGEYRFKLDGQLNGNERTVIFNSQSTTVSSASTSILSLDKNLFSSAKSTVSVSYGNGNALHQVMVIYDGTSLFTLQYPFLSIGSNSGIGTFGAEIVGNNFDVIFYPDESISEEIEVLSFNESFYSELDFENTPPSLRYSPVKQSVKVANYYGINSQNIDKLDFEMTYQDTPIFVKSFDPSNLNILNYATGEFTIDNHFFSTGEQLIYTPKSTFIGVGASPMGIGATLNNVGVVTNRLPSVLYAIKDNNYTFRLATRKEYALAGIGVTFTSPGLGNSHELEMFKKNEKCIITINNVAQYPISYTNLNSTLTGNGGQIGSSSTIFSISGIGSINPTDLIKINNEYMKVNNVGLGTTNTGPITFQGNVSLVEVERGFIGSKSSTHLDSSQIKVYKGSYNISGNKIFFTQPPRGNSLDLIYPDERNLPRERASFSGRVFLRNDYTSNQVYDDISNQFDGITKTFKLTKDGADVVGLGTSGGNGVVFINSIFQSPTTSNNSNNNYYIQENLNTGITSITFTGITSANSENNFISLSDINQNELPRGGIIVSLGSSLGLGYEPDTYENLPIIGVSRLGIGETTETGTGLLMNVEVGPYSTTGIGSTLFEVKSFKITRPGYGFKKGDIFKPVGLKTSTNLSSPISEFTLTVLETFNDSFSCWQFGELDYIDSIKEYQNGVRTSFPLYYKGELLSFQKDNNDLDSQAIDLDAILVIFINGILQEPKESYNFSGGTSFEFSVAPKPEDNVSIFFYRGTKNEDSFIVDVTETIKVGDAVRVYSNNTLQDTITQNSRIVYNILSADTIETQSYRGDGIDQINLKPLYWTKQKSDLIINNDVVSKSRESLEPQIYPTANIIKNLSPIDTEVFVDEAELFEYDKNDEGFIFDAVIYNNDGNSIEVDTLKDVSTIQGFSCAIIGIATTSGIGVPLGIKFTISSENTSKFSSLQVGYPVYVSNTNVGAGVTSINSNQNQIVSISTSFVNNIYYVHAYDSNTGILTCNISSNTSTVGIATTGSLNYPVGYLSWGRLSGFSRSSSPISVAVTGYVSSIGISTFGYSSGLSTYPSIQRRAYGLRNNGALL